MDKNRNNTIYRISGASHEETIEERLALYGYIRQLAFLTRHMETVEDYFHLKKVAGIYEGYAEDMFASWHIPEAFLVGDTPHGLEAIKEKELLDYDAEDDPDSGEPAADDDGAEDDSDGTAFLEILEDMAEKAHFLAEALDIMRTMDGNSLEADPSLTPAEEYFHA